MACYIEIEWFVFTIDIMDIMDQTSHVGQTGNFLPLPPPPLYIYTSLVIIIVCIFFSFPSLGLQPATRSDAQSCTLGKPRE